MNSPYVYEPKNRNFERSTRTTYLGHPILGGRQQHSTSLDSHPSNVATATGLSTSGISTGMNSATMSTDDIAKLTSELKTIVSATEDGITELVNLGGGMNAPAVVAVVAAARKLAEANAELWKEVYSRKATAAEEKVMECVRRMEGMAGMASEHGSAAAGGNGDSGDIAVFTNP